MIIEKQSTVGTPQSSHIEQDRLLSTMENLEAVFKLLNMNVGFKLLCKCLPNVLLRKAAIVLQ